KPPLRSTPKLKHAYTRCFYNAKTKVPASYGSATAKVVCRWQTIHTDWKRGSWSCKQRAQRTCPHPINRPTLPKSGNRTPVRLAQARKGMGKPDGCAHL